MIFDFFFNDTATTEIYTLSLHDALPILVDGSLDPDRELRWAAAVDQYQDRMQVDRKSTRLNSSHANISYAVFCLKKKIHALLITRSNLFTDRRTVYQILHPKARSAVQLR